MATLTVDLVDSKGNDVDFGDLVRVELPEIITDRFDGVGFIDGDFYAPAETIIAKIHFQLSRGILLKVKSAVNPCMETSIKVGQIIKFKHTIWEFEKLDNI